MLKNPNFVYGPTDVVVPSNLHFGEFMVNRMLQHKDVTIVNGLTHEVATLGQIAQQSVNLAVSLTRLGIRKGAKVALCSENRMEFWSSVIGSLLSGAVLTTCNLTYTKGEITHVMAISKPKCIICSQTAFRKHEETFKSLKHVEKIIVYGEGPKGAISFNDLVSNDVNIEEFRAVEVEGQRDLAFILYSSGTTGMPKGVMLTHLNCLNTFCFPHIEAPFTPVVLNVNPWFHTMGLMGVLTLIATGRAMVYLPRFDMDLYLKTIEKYKVTVLHVVPPILVALTKTEITNDMSSVMMVFSGAAPLRTEVSNAVQKLFPNALPVLQGYGMTETTLAVTKNYNFIEPKPGSVGMAAHTVIIKVVDLKTKKPVGPNQEGEICVKGGIVMKGYVGKDRREDFDEEGFFKTGDVGYYDDDGYFYIVDRLKELIKYKGYQVAPAEIEAVLLQHPAVRDAGVVGAPHAAGGEAPLAFVAAQPGARVTEKELEDFVAARVSPARNFTGTLSSLLGHNSASTVLLFAGRLEAAGFRCYTDQ